MSIDYKQLAIMRDTDRQAVARERAWYETLLYALETIDSMEYATPEDTDDAATIIRAQSSIIDLLQSFRPGCIPRRAQVGEEPEPEYPEYPEYSSWYSKADRLQAVMDRHNLGELRP